MPPLRQDRTLRSSSRVVLCRREDLGLVRPVPPEHDRNGGQQEDHGHAQDADHQADVDLGKKVNILLFLGGKCLVLLFRLTCDEGESLEVVADFEEDEEEAADCCWSLGRRASSSASSSSLVCGEEEEEDLSLLGGGGGGAGMGTTGVGFSSSSSGEGLAGGETGLLADVGFGGSAVRKETSESNIHLSSKKRRS